MYKSAKVGLWYTVVRNAEVFLHTYTSVEGSYLPSNRNSPRSERIENAPLAILISNEQFKLHACFGVIRRECEPFRDLPLDGFICTSAPLTDMRSH